MAKGHRGFLAGDMIMIMYAWTNNWKALTEAQDIVNLYARRSFDGGQDLDHAAGQLHPHQWHHLLWRWHFTCEFMGSNRARQLSTRFVRVTPPDSSSRPAISPSSLAQTITVIDPRYAPTTRTINTAWVTTSSLPAGFVALVRSHRRYAHVMMCATPHASTWSTRRVSMPPMMKAKRKGSTCSTAARWIGAMTTWSGRKR
jgi:hypothetical protein